MTLLKAPNKIALAPDYAQAQDYFLQQAKAAGGTAQAFAHGQKGPANEALATDTLWLGPPNPQNLLIISSGTHGVEGAAGSMCQSALLVQLAEALPQNTAALMIHAINPWGFAHDRRVNENNVDMNRNFLDDFARTPENSGYLDLHDAICPPHWTDDTQAQGRAAMRAFGQKHGGGALQSALSAGQYVKPQGVYFGGTAPEWSNGVMHNILGTLPPSVQKTIFIDIHTGLGPFGVGELILEIPNSDPMAQLAHNIFGPGVASTVSGNSVSAALQGPMDFAVQRALGPHNVLFTALEFGTVSPKHVFAAVQADNWLHMHGDPRNAGAQTIKQQIRAAFRPDATEWAHEVTRRTFEVTNQALAGFSTDWPE